MPRSIPPPRPLCQSLSIASWLFRFRQIGFHSPNPDYWQTNEGDMPGLARRLRLVKWHSLRVDHQLSAPVLHPLRRAGRPTTGPELRSALMKGRPHSSRDGEDQAEGSAGIVHRGEQDKKSRCVAVTPTAGRNLAVWRPSNNPPTGLSLMSPRNPRPVLGGSAVRVPVVPPWDTHAFGARMAPAVSRGLLPPFNGGVFAGIPALWNLPRWGHRVWSTRMSGAFRRRWASLQSLGRHMETNGAVVVVLAVVVGVGGLWFYARLRPSRPRLLSVRRTPGATFSPLKIHSPIPGRSEHRQVADCNCFHFSTPLGWRPNPARG